MEGERERGRGREGGREGGTHSKGRQINSGGHS